MCAPWGSHPAVEKGPVTHPHRKCLTYFGWKLVLIIVVALDPLRILGCGKGPEDNGRPLALFRDIRGASAGGAVAWWKVEAAKDEPKRQETTEGDVGFEMVENGQTEGEGQNVLISEESLATEEG